MQLKDIRPHMTVVNDDTFNIVSRLKAIDDGYVVVVNNLTNNLEVRNAKQLGDSYCLTLPYSSLDARTIDLVLRTRTQNVKNILRQMDEDNARLYRQQSDKKAVEILKKVQAVL